MALALFDLDNTLLDGDSDFLWGEFLVELGAVPPAEFGAANRRFYQQYLDGTLDKHPGLRVIGVHAGGYLPSYLGRTDVACQVRNNANCANKKSPREYFRQELFIDTMIFSDEGLRHLVAEVGAGQIVYGTDNPLNWPVTVDLVLEALARARHCLRGVCDQQLSIGRGGFARYPSPDGDV